MNQTRRKPRILFFALLIVMIVLCGVVAVLPYSFAEDASGTEYETVTGEWYEVKYNDNALELRLSDSFSKYINAGTGEVKRFAGDMMTVLKEIFMNNLLSSKSQSIKGVNPIDLPIDLPNIPEIDDDFWNDPNLNQKLQGFKDMVEERLKDPDELDKYLEGEYNFMLEQAIGSYIEHKTESGEATDQDKLDELYQKIEDQIQSVVDKVVEEVADELFKDKPEEEKEELKKQFIEESVKKSKDVVQKAATVVQENDGKAPEITADDIIRELRAVMVEGEEVMSKENGLSVSGLKKVISLIPRPNEIANMGQDEIRNLIKADVLVVTTFGDVKLNVTFGFFGDTQLIQKAAAFLADHIDFSYANGKLDLNINVPQVVSEMMLKITESASIPDSTKKGIFAIFGRTGSENLEQLKGFTFEQFIDLLESVDYRNMFNNLLNADFINTYFGNFFKQAIGHELTQKQIDNFIDKFADRAASFANKDWTYDEALDFLKNNIPGFNSIFGSIESATLEKAVNKLLSIVNKIDWAKYDAAKVHEMLSESTTFNDTIYSYIEQFADFDNVYDTIIDYIEKAYGYLPQVFKDKSFIDMYDGNNDYSFNGTFDFNFKNIVEKIGSTLLNHGFGSIGNALKNAATTLENKTTELSVNFTMNMPNVYKVEYVIGEKTVAGLLPDGAAVDLFGDEKAEERYDVLYWIEEECGEPVEVMPARDVKLYAVTNFEVKGYVDDEQTVSIEKSYDEKDAILRAEVDGVSFAEYTYAWYKDDELIEDATENTFAVCDVNDSGNYKVVVTDKFSGYAVDTLVFDVKIDPADLDLSEAKWYKGDDIYTNQLFVENGEGQSPVLGGVSEDILSHVEYEYYVSNDGEVGDKLQSAPSTAGTYFVRAVPAHGYQFINFDDADIEFTIVAATELIDIDVTDAIWNVDGAPYEDSIVFDGNARNFTLVKDGKALENVTYQYYKQGVVTPLDGAPTDAGTYVVWVVANEGYRLTGATEDHSLTFTIDKLRLDNPVTTFTVPTKADGGKYKLNIVYAESKYFSHTVDGDTETTKSGKYTFSVVYTIKNEYKNNVCFTDTQGGDTIEFAETFEWELYTDGKLFENGKVTVRDLENYLPKDASLSVSKANPNLDDYRKELKDKYKDYDARMGVAYDIHFEDASHNELNTKGHKFRVSIAIPEELISYPDRRLAVIHIGDDGKIEFIDGAVRVDDNMEFEVDGFSIYAVIALDPVEIGNWWLIVLLVLLVVLVLLALLLRFLRKPEPAPATEQAAAPAESKPEEPAQSAVTESAPAAPVVVPVAPPADEISRISFSRSFESRLAQMDDSMKEKYSELKNYLLSHKKVRGRMSWRFESFNKGRNKICKLQFKGKSLMMYIALDPDTLDPKYHHKSLKDKPRFALTPTLLKIKSARSLKYAKELIDMVLQQTDTELRKNFVPVNYVTEYKTTEQLIDEGKIKVKVTHTLQIWEVEAAAAKAQASETAETENKEAQPAENATAENKEAQAPENTETENKEAQPAENTETENKEAQAPENTETENKEAQPAEDKTTDGDNKTENK